jgi:hypothetical protein
LSPQPVAAPCVWPLSCRPPPPLCLAIISLLKRSSSITRCNHSSKCTWITQSHFEFTTKGDEWERVCSAHKDVKMFKKTKRDPQIIELLDSSLCLLRARQVSGWAPRVLVQTSHVHLQRSTRTALARLSDVRMHSSE